MARTEHTPLDDLELDALFADMREQTPEPDAALTARILSDAARVQAGFQDEAGTARRPGRPAQPRGLFASLGGWRAMAGLATAALTGVWLGFSGPETLTDEIDRAFWADSSAQTAYSLEDLMPGTGDFSALFEES